MVCGIERNGSVRGNKNERWKSQASAVKYAEPYHRYFAVDLNESISFLVFLYGMYRWMLTLDMEKILETFKVYIHGCLEYFDVEYT